MNSSAKEIQMQYVSIRRVIEDANKKYKLFTGNQVEDDYLINTMQKTIIATIKKESNGIDYYKENQGKKKYKIAKNQVNYLIGVILRDYFSKKSQAFDVSILQAEDKKLIDDSFQKLGRTKQEKDSALSKIENNPQYIKAKDMAKVEKEVTESIQNSVTDDSIDPINQIDTDLFTKYKQLNINFKQEFNHDLKEVKRNIIFKNSLQHSISNFYEVEYVKDYVLRELHTINWNGQRLIVSYGYSKYDKKLHDPLNWYCE